jgi:predicted DNA-binding transcriptional regulator AlpA
MPSMNGDNSISRDQAARMLHVSRNTILRWSRDQFGPPFFRVGRKVLYLERDVSAWLASRREQPSDTGIAPPPLRRARRVSVKPLARETGG